MAVDWQELCGADPVQVQDALLAELDSLMNGLSDQQEDEQLARIAVPLRVMWLLEWLDFEVTQGSLIAY